MTVKELVEFINKHDVSVDAEIYFINDDNEQFEVSGYDYTVTGDGDSFVNFRL